MANFIRKRRIIIQKVEMKSLELHKEVEIRLPANVKKVTGILITGHYSIQG